MIFIIIPVFNRWYFTEKCLISLLKQNYLNYKIIVVDHGSTDDTFQRLKYQFPDIIVLSGDDSMWWTRAMNLGVNFVLNYSKSEDDFILTLNNDLEVNPNYLSELLKVYNENKPAIVGSTSLDFNDVEKICFIGITWNKYIAKHKVLKITNSKYSVVKELYSYTESDLLQGRGTLMPINIFEKIGLFDEINFPHYAADEDFSLRCKAIGFKLLVSVNATVKSHVSATGLNFKNKSQNIFSFFKSLFLINTPNNLKVRYKWAKKHTPYPIFYCMFDFSRIFFSYIKNSLIDGK